MDSSVLCTNSGSSLVRDATLSIFVCVVCAPDSCTKLSGCAPAPPGTTQGRPVCLPKWAAALNKQGADALAQQIQKMDPLIFGSCEATCWLKKVGTRMWGNIIITLAYCAASNVAAVTSYRALVVAVLSVAAMRRLVCV